MKDRVIIITGPTASGKSDIAIDLALKLDAEIISSDSQQIYKYMNIGTNKVSIDELQKVKHHMIDIIEADEDYSVEEFSKQARRIISDINKRNKIAILTGGTGFYIDSILFNYNYGAGKKDLEYRKKLENLAKENGNEFIYNLLMDIDPVTAKKYHPNERNRIIRNLEIYKKTREKPSEVKKGNNKINDQIDFFIVTINYKDRQKLYEKINKRVKLMINEGLVEETQNLVQKYNLDKYSKSLKAIGYKEAYSYLQGEISLEKLEYDIAINTRHYAKRQITWMKKYNKFDNSMLVFREDFKDKNSISNRIIDQLKRLNFEI
ncbi:MAG: tRNA (adenosine(37)-N6)-dimethylallyltransferase MiaA [Tissierellia bacterium]|nr:tRNA (adenosine(37)-N6)-dimethylallyltransferase MiaA [Tissierellia bacterium]